MKELNEILGKYNLNTLSIDEFIEIAKDLYEIYVHYREQLNSLNVQKALTINHVPYFKEALENSIRIIEDQLTDIPSDVQVELSSDMAHILSFIKAIDNLDKKTYSEFRETIYFRFVIIIGNFYLSNLIKKLKLVRIAIDPINS